MPAFSLVREPGTTVRLRRWGIPPVGGETMADDEIFEISRRKALAGLGTIGLASAGAGLGTSAFFSDTENFAGNVLQAGALDLKIDWEEHYSDWSPDEAAAVSDIVMIDQYDSSGNKLSDADLVAQVPSDYVGLPNPDAPLIAVPEADLVAFMNATSIEAYPDENGNGIQDQDPETGNPVFPGGVDICDTDSDLPTALSASLRTQNEDTFDEVNQAYKPLVSIDDVKPGDFGELTLSFHLCDNPGYVWLQGECTAAENGYTEPELDDPDETADANGDGQDDRVELLDEIQTIAWYDQDGDNVLDGGVDTSVCAILVLDSSGSMTDDDGDGVSRQDEMKTGAKQLANALLGADPDNRVGVLEFNGDANVLLSVGAAGAQSSTDVENAIDTVDASGATDIAAAISTADSDLANCPEASSRKVMIVVTDGQNNAGSGPVQTASDAAVGGSGNTDEIFAVGTGGATQASLAAIASPDDDAHIELTSDLTNAIANLTQVVLGEETFFNGTLRELCEALSTPYDADGDGVADFDVPGIPLDGNRVTPERDCFNALDTHHIGIAWWLPVDHANEIQTDSVAFDLGFYTEQCRHNDGSGQPTAAPNGASP